MTYHLFGNILTFYGVAANNRGETQGNITTLQKLLWKGETHTKISAEAVRWAIRYFWQKAGYQVNRVWDDRVNDYTWQDPKFNPLSFIDDDVLGWFETESAKKDSNDQSEATKSNTSAKQRKRSNKKQPEEQPAEIDELSSENREETTSNKKQQPPKGSSIFRRGGLDVTRAVSTRPYNGDITFNARTTRGRQMERKKWGFCSLVDLENKSLTTN